MIVMMIDGADDDETSLPGTCTDGLPKSCAEHGVAPALMPWPLQMLAMMMMRMTHEIVMIDAAIPGQDKQFRFQ